LVKTTPSERITLLERNFSFEQKHFKFNDIRQPKASLGYLGSIRSIADTSVLQRALSKYRVSINGAATNNLQATTVPTNSGTATYTGRRLLGSKEAGLMQDILNMVFRVRELLPYGLLFRTKSIQHRSWILFIKWFSNC
jgi:hypothetical protein